MGSRIVDNQLVAIKKIKKNEILDLGVVNGKSYPLEYLILNKLSSCDGVNKLLDAYVTDTELLLVLELVEEACTLEDWIVKNGAQSESFVKGCFRKLVEAVGKCHQEGVLHRDLKSGNILMNKNKPSEPQLIDFGFCALVENSPFSEFIGSYGFMAPEVYDESKKYEGLHTEVYSLGVILYDMITGSIALFPPPETKTNANDDELVVPADVSILCLQLIDLMLSTCPSDRPTIANILQHPWLNQ